MLKVNNLNLETASYGPSPDKAPTIIFLHEGLGCVEMWRDFPQQVSEATGLGVFVYSRQGYGGSDGCNLPLPLTFMHHEGLDVLPELIKAAGIKKHILFGHSDGASISLIYAGGAECRNLAGLIVEAPHIFCEGKTVNHIRKAKELYEKGDLKEKLRKYHGENTDCAFYGWNGAWLDPDFMKWNIEEYLPNIKTPVFVIQGIDDDYGSLGHMQGIEKMCGGEVKSLALENCGHSPHKDQREKVLEATVKFINDII